LLGLILVQFARGELAGAEQTVVLLSQLDVDTLSYETEDTLAARAWLQFLRGDVVSAWRWADAYTAPVPDQPLYGPEDPRIVRARLLLARGADADVQTAQQIVDALYDVAERTHNTRFRIVLLAMRALALEAQGRSDAAHASLQHAVELARPGGIIRAFADLGSPMQALLSRLAGQGVAGEAVRHILTAFPVPEPEKKLHPPAQSPPPLVEPLTARELDILPLLRERLSNKEIAEKLGISIVTVKRHIANLSSKLGVHKRLDVVATAEALGILPPR
jgi:LuxR family maltose regulon positive regulatory protein